MAVRNDADVASARGRFMLEASPGRTGLLGQTWWVAIDLTSKTLADGLFNSTVDLKGQFVSEELLRRLAPPKMPHEILRKRSTGKADIRASCACNAGLPRRQGPPAKLWFYEINLWLPGFLLGDSLISHAWTACFMHIARGER